MNSEKQEENPIVRPDEVCKILDIGRNTFIHGVSKRSSRTSASGGLFLSHENASIQGSTIRKTKGGK